MAINELRGTLSSMALTDDLVFLKETVIIQWNISKEYLQLFATKLREKIPDPSKDKKHCQSCLKRKIH